MAPTPKSTTTTRKNTGKKKKHFITKNRAHKMAAKKFFLQTLDQDDFENPINEDGEILPQFKLGRTCSVEFGPIFELDDGTLPIFYGLSEQKPLAMCIFRLHHLGRMIGLLTYDRKEHSHVVWDRNTEIFRLRLKANQSEYDLTNLRVNLLPLTLAMTWPKPK